MHPLFLVVWLIHCVWADSVELTGATIHDLTSKGTWLIEHFSPYCPHCVEFAPTWKQLASDEAHLAASKSFHFGTIDCTVQGDLCIEHDIRSYPSIQLYADGKYVETYTGSRSLEDLSSYVAQQADGHASTPPQHPDTRSDEVIALSPDSFTKVRQHTEPWFVKFYTPWCPHCQRLAPTWEMLAKELQDTDIHVAEVNCQDHGPLCTENDVDGYPTLKMFSAAGVNQYRGDRSLVNLVSFAKKLAGPHISNLESGQALLDKLKDTPVAVVYLQKDRSDTPSALLQSVASEFVASSLSFFTLAMDTQAQTWLGSAPRHLPALVIAKDHGQRQIVYPGNDFHDDDSKKAVIDWIQAEKFPSVSTISSTNAEELLRGNRRVVLAVMDKTDQVSQTAFHRMAERVHARLGSRVLFAWLDATLWGNVAKQDYGVQSEDMPAVILIDGPNQQYFDRDATRQQRYSLDDTDGVEHGIDAMLTGQRVGISTRPLHGRVGQTLSDLFGYAQVHWMASCIVLAIFASLLYKQRRSKGSLFPVKQELGDHRD